MTKKEMATILKTLLATYPNTKIKDIDVTLASWMMEFEEYPSEVIEIAVRFHMKKSSFFPSIAEVRSQIPRAEILKQFEENNKPKAVDPERERQTSEELQTIINDMIEMETEMYSDFLDFER